MASVHPARRNYLVHAPGAIVVQNYWKHWPCLFPQTRPWHPSDVLRGLFHSDGCRVNNWATRMAAGQKKRDEYPRWQFVNESADIMRWCGVRASPASTS